MEGRGTSTSGITEIGNYGHTEKPEGRYDGYTEGRIYESTEKRLRKGKSEGSLELRPKMLKVGRWI